VMVPRLTTFCPGGKAQHVDELSVECWWNYMDKDKTEVPDDSPEPFQLCPPQVCTLVCPWGRPRAPLRDLRAHGKIDSVRLIL
jgi:hypothetical protein